MEAVRAGRGRRRWSVAALAAGAPVGGPIALAEPGRPDRRAAARAGTPRTPVHGTPGPGAGHRRAHLPARPGEHRLQLLVARTSESERGRDASRPQALREPHVPEPRDEPLVEQHLAQQTAWIGLPDARTNASGSTPSARMSGPTRRAGVTSSVSTGPFHWAASSSPARRTSHGRPARLVPGPPDGPAAVHAQVAPNDDSSLETQQEMLADRVDRLEHATVDSRRDAGEEPARVRRRRLHPASHEHAEPLRSTVDRIALRHLAARVEQGGRSRHV